MTVRKKNSGSTAIAKWDAELAAQAEVAAKQESNVGGGQFFSLRGGCLKLNDAPLPNNEMAVIIIESVIENVFYEGDFDPENPSNPSCYAFGKDESEMKPYQDCLKPQCENCSDCEDNKWGSATKGKGKACRNRRRLALASAGTIERTTGELQLAELSDIEKGEIAYLALPPTSIRGYASYVKQVAQTLKRPPHGVVTRIAVVPDEKTQFKVTFELLEPVSFEWLPIIMEKHIYEKKAIIFPYQDMGTEVGGRLKSKNKTRKRKY